MQLRSAQAPCPYGRLALALSEDGLFALALGDAPEALDEELRGRAPEASWTEDAAGLAPVIEEVLACLADPTRPYTGPLDLRGTAFQQRVWQALQEIPLGQTSTYSALAAQLGKPRGAQAVANACAANPVAVLVPCHRVLRTSGDLAGYRWGLERKRALLRAEGALLTLF